MEQNHRNCGDASQAIKRLITSRHLLAALLMSSFLKLGSIYHAMYGWAHARGQRKACPARLDLFFGDAGEWPGRGGPRQRNILWIISLFIAATKTCLISSAMSKSRDVASRASTSMAGEGSGISLVCSLPRCRIVTTNVAEGALRAAGCDNSFCSRVCAMPTEPGAGILPLTSAVWRRKLLWLRRKLMPSLEHVT